MEQIVRHCHVCGKGIPLSDLESYRAIILLKRCYCPNCTTALETTLPRPPASTRRLDRFGVRLILGLATASASLVLFLYFLGALGRGAR